MGLIDNMAEKMRNGIRSFLKIEPAQSNIVYINERLDFNTNAIKNRIWYRGDSGELSDLYKHIDVDRTMFWKEVPTPGLEIRKIHTGLPSTIVDILVSIVMSDLNEIVVTGKELEWKAISDDNDFYEVVSSAIADTLVVGDGAFKFTVDQKVSPYPLIEFISGENVEFQYQHGRVTSVVFKTKYLHNHKTYVLEETYGVNYIQSILYDGYDMDRQVPLQTIPQTENLSELVTFSGDFMMAVPFKFHKSSKWKGRGRSIFDSKCDNFDSLDEIWSQWMGALRSGRSKEYIPQSLLPRNPHTGEILKPNAFDNRYIQSDESLSEGNKSEITLIQPAIPHESYLATYITALDLCLQGIISPSTLGIDTKKLDNADAQREKEKTTLYTRNKIVESLRNILPVVVNVAIKVYETLNNQAVTNHEVEIPFGEYANPSFESQVETVSKGKTGGIMSVEAAVEELYGDSKDMDWKAAEVARLKAEQGITDVEEPAVNLEGVELESDAGGQASVLNGAQIGSLMNVIRMVKEGSVTRTEGISIITSTLGISREAADTFIEDNGIEV